jgi:hypothetical protein
LLWLILILVTVINVAATQFRFYSGSRRDSERLRSALHAELRELLRLYDDNLARLRGNGGFLLSSRGHTVVYKGSIARLHFLRDLDIPAIVSLYALNDRIEGLVAATCKEKTPAAYVLAPNETPVEEIARQYEIGRESLLRLTHAK